MKSFDEAHMIYVPEMPLSLAMAQANKRINEQINGFTVNLYAGFNPETCFDYFKQVKLDSTKVQPHPTSMAVWQRPGVKGCYASHHSLWLKSYQENKTLMIMEHDAVPIRRFADFGFDEIINLAYPLSEAKFLDVPFNQNVQPHTYVKQNLHMMKGLVAYVIKPQAAKKLIQYSYDVGVGPADNACCGEAGINREEMNPPMYTIMSTLSSTSRLEQFNSVIVSDYYK